MDPELERIRNMRLQELQMSQDQHKRQADEDDRRREEEMRSDMLYSMMDNGARERLHRIRMVKEHRARAIEDMLISRAKMNMIPSRITESMLIEFLSLIPDNQSPQTKFTYIRKTTGDDDD